MKKIISLILMLSSLITFTACSPYVSKYSATMLERSNTGEGCRASWSTLQGTLVLNTEKPGSGEGAIRYTASIEEGEMTVYYNIPIFGDTKTELFKISGGESVDSRGGYIEGGNKLYIIIETAGKTKDGNLKISFD